MIRSVALFVCAMTILSVPASAKPAGTPLLRCVDSSRPDALVTLAGKLTVRTFPGPPNYESIAGGDLEERAFILELPRLICFTDGEFADGYERFDRVHVYATDQDVIDALNAAIGREVLVEGRAMGAHTGHHRAPMVLRANSVKTR